MEIIPWSNLKTAFDINDLAEKLAARLGIQENIQEYPICLFNSIRYLRNQTD